MKADQRVSRAGFLRGAAAAGAAAGLMPGWAEARKAVRGPRTLREKVESLFVVSFAGATPQGEVMTLLQRHAIGGVTLFSRNIQSPSQLQSLIAGLQRVARYPLLVSTDQEGGLVTRITQGVPSYPSEASYGQLGSAQRVQHDAAVMAADIRAMGLTMNLAPVVDVLANPTSPIGSRSYGSSPQLVARLSTAAIKGYQSAGLAATAKHFIGLGHTSIDSHQSLPVVNLTWQQLQASDLVSWRAAIAAGVSTVLVAHVVLPKIDPVKGRPASLSPVAITQKLRGELGFKGVVMTDSLLMGALAAPGPAAAAEQAFAAGADLLLLAVNHDFPLAVIEDAIDRVYTAVKSGRISQSRLDSSMARLAALKRRFPGRF